MVGMDRRSSEALWWVYVLHCTGQCFYVGISSDVGKRYLAHVSGHAALFTRAHPPVSLVGALPVGSRAQAVQLERKVKRWRPHLKVSRFAPHQHAWNRYRLGIDIGERTMADNIDSVLVAISQIDEERRLLELKVWQSCASVSPELITLLIETWPDIPKVSAWLCASNSLLAGRSPAIAISEGDIEEVIGMVVRATHGIN